MDSYAVRVKKARPGEMMAYNNNRWYTPGWEQSKDRDRAGDDVAEKRSEVAKIHRFLAFILADALGETKPK